MNVHRTAALIFLAAFSLGIAGDVLLRHGPWGINVFLWTTAFAIVAVAFLQRFRPQPWISVALPAIGAIAAASGIVWRDAEPLIVLDTLLIVPMLALLALGPRGVRVWATGVMRIAGAILVSAAQSIAGIFQLPFDLEWKRANAGRASRAGGTVIRGILIALPALFIFGLLLMSADEAFATIIRNLIVIDMTDMVVDVVVTIVIAAACAGFLRSLLIAGTWMPWNESFEIKRLRAGDLSVALALLDGLFFLFVAVQVRYLFAGTPVRGMTYSEYARRGFFELVVVTVLVVPMLLAAEWIADKTDARALRGFRLLAWLQIALVLVIAASAYKRMQLYREAYGLTEMRLYTTAFLFWIGVVLVWLGVTVLTGRRAQFAVGVLVTGVIALVSLHAIDPEAVIVRTNRAHPHPFDAKYAMTLSADATPHLVTLNDPCVARRILQKDAHRSIDWRTWNMSRQRAHDAVEANRARLTQLAAQCPAR